MKPVKSFDEFRKELNEARSMNEGIVDTIKGALKKIGEFFTGVGSSFLNALIKQKKKELPKGVTVYPSPYDISLLKKHGVNVTMPTNESQVSFDYEIEDTKMCSSDLVVVGRRRR